MSKKKHWLKICHIVDHGYDPRKCPFEVNKTYKTVGGWDATIYRIATYEDGIVMEVFHDIDKAPAGKGGYAYHRADGRCEIYGDLHKVLLN